jgi:RNA polymerase sigma factor (sigma-70 family)
MVLREEDRIALLKGCGDVVDRLMAQRDWQLLDRDEWVRIVVERVVAGPVTDPHRVAVYAYSEVLHAACSGAAGALAQNRGYDEILRYLLERARRRYPPFAEDVAQRAAESTFALFERCRVPGALLAFAAQQLLRAIRDHIRQEYRAGWPTAAPVEAAFGETQLADQTLADLAEPMIAEELRKRFEELTIEFLNKHPRAAQQLSTLRLKYIDGLDDVAISRRLGKPIGSVYVLRSRAAEKLRAEPAWRELAAEFGIFSEV